MNDGITHPLDLWAFAIDARVRGDDATHELLWGLFLEAFDRLPTRDRAIMTAAILRTTMERCGWPDTH